MLHTVNELHTELQKHSRSSSKKFMHPHSKYRQGYKLVSNEVSVCYRSPITLALYRRAPPYTRVSHQGPHKPVPDRLRVRCPSIVGPAPYRRAPPSKPVPGPGASLRPFDLGCAALSLQCQAPPIERAGGARVGASRSWVGLRHASLAYYARRAPPNQPRARSRQRFCTCARCAMRRHHNLSKSCHYSQNNES